MTSIGSGYGGEGSEGYREETMDGLQRQASMKRVALYNGATHEHSNVRSRTVHVSPTRLYSEDGDLQTPAMQNTQNNSTATSTSQRSFTDSTFRTFSSSSSGSPHRPSEASRLRMLNSGSTPQLINGRHTPDMHIPENFSRPRKRSIKLSDDSPNQATASAPTASMQSNGFPVRKASLAARNRGLSTSSSQPAATFPSLTLPLRPSVSIPDLSLQDSTQYRPRDFTTNRLGKGTQESSVRGDFNLRMNGMDNEVRSSFKSALTAGSSYFGTSGTERSSVMTKSSSATSIYGRDDGMSVDDAIGMYEGGFTDSGAEDDNRSRPTTSLSFRSGFGAPAGADAGIDVLPPPSFSNMIIRDSTAIFSAPMKGSFDGGNDFSEPKLTSRVQQHQPEYLVRSPRRPDTGQKFQFDQTRDIYGFRKKSQYVPIDQYEEWNGPYTEHITRRRKKWVALMKESNLSSERPAVFPPKSNKVKRFVRKGIPPEWRGEAWWWYAEGPALLSKNVGVYDSLVTRARTGDLSAMDEELIERDLNRTFPDNIRFKPDVMPCPGEFDGAGHSDTPEPETPILQSLRRVLQAFAIYNPKIGYCQSLNFLAGLLLLFMEEEKAFWTLRIITSIYLPGTHEVNLEGANVDLGVLMMSIKESLPPVWAKIGGELDGTANVSSDKVPMRLPPITLCLTAWFMSCFIGTLPIESTLRVWDTFFYEGSKTLFRVAMAIFKLGEVEIKAVSDPMEIFQVVQTIPRRLIDANALMDAWTKRRNGFGHLSQETIERRRGERREGYAEERRMARAEANGTGIESLGRKTTIFSRKRAKTRVAIEGGMI